MTHDCLLDRRTLLGGIAAAAATPLLNACAVSELTGKAAGSKPRIAITVDDFNLEDTVLLTGEARDHRIRGALRRHGIKAAGFVAGKYVGNDKGGRVLAAWSRDGHILGNHSFSHLYYGGKEPERMMADILRCEKLLVGYLGFRKLFRFPMLAEGRTAEGRDRLRLLLREHGYANGHVTIDTSDWAIDSRLKARLKADPRADVAPYRRFYLDHVWDRATYYDGLANHVFGHSLPHTLLIHHNLTSGLFLGDLLAMFRGRGWSLIDAGTAFAAPEFHRDYDSLPSGQSLIWAAAKASGRFDDQLRYPGEDEKYEAPKLDALKL